MQGDRDRAGGRAGTGHHTPQSQAQEDIVDARLGHQQLLRVFVVAQARRQGHACQARVTVPAQEPLGQQYCGRKGGYAELGCGAGRIPGERERAGPEAKVGRGI